MKRQILLILILLAVLTNYAQKQANYWYFGHNAGLNFGMGVPVALTNGQIYTGEGCSSISTPAGNLEFYTDGRFVYNKNHGQMPHGSGLLGHSSSTQSGIIVPKPASTTQYYIFTVDAYDNNLANGLCYSRVDMTLDGGLGDVVTSEKNISLIPLTCEKVTAVGHSNGISIWVITHQWGTDAFYAYEITTTGVNQTPVISHTGPPLTGDMQASKGYIKVSPDGSKIAMANNTAFNIGIFNFNHANGTVSHLVTDYSYVNPGGGDPGGPYGVEFSPNSHLLYIGEWKANRRISQYDVSSGVAQTILDSKVIVATVGQNSDPIGALQLGPDNRMYVARHESPYLSRINSPNTIGNGCGFTDNAINLAGRESTYGLPPFIQSFFYLTVDFYWDTPVCDGTPVQFYSSASDNPDSVKWTFGDPGSGSENTSTLLNPSHLYPTTGNYWVTLIVYLYGVAKNVFHIIVVNEPPEVFIGNDTTICASEPFYLDAGAGFDGYLWQNGDTTQTIQAGPSGLYWCQVTGDGGCTDIDSVNLVINPLPVVSAGPDIIIPSGVSTILEGAVTGGSGNFTYQWQPEALLVDANVLQPTTVPLSFTTQFFLTVTDNEGGCFAEDDVMVTISGGVLGCNPAADPTSICFGEQSQLQAMAFGGTGNYTYLWTSSPLGFTSDIPNPVAIPAITTTYYLTLSDEFSSVGGNVMVTVNQLPVPNAGSNQTIPYGSSATLQGSAGSGSGSYNYHWEPAEKLINPNIAQAVTIDLIVTTEFTLSVTDAISGCVCSQMDNVIVTISGGALTFSPVADPDTICNGEQSQLHANAASGSGNYEFTWTSNPPGYSSNLPNPVVSPEQTTTYSVAVGDGFTSVFGDVVVTVLQLPVPNAGADHTVPYGTPTQLLGSASSGSGAYIYHWEPAVKLINPNIPQPFTINLTETTSFTLHVTDAQTGCVCLNVDEVLVTVSGGPLTCNPVANPAMICYGGQTTLQAMASGGSGDYTYVWTSNPPGFNSEIYNPVVSPLQTTTYLLTINDGFNSFNGNVVVTVYQLPVPEAGSDQTIPNGTSTSLQGSASLGSGNYSYHWEPADKLVNPYNPQPTTVLLDETTLFTLSVTDAQTGCVCGQTDNVIVFITGNALAVNPEAHPDTICSGETTQLSALASGGAGNMFYDFTWSSSPAGFTSTEENPGVQPLITTTYTVMLYDGYKTVNGYVTVVVNPAPVINLGPDATVCVFDTLTLDAGNPGSSYVWSNGSTAKTIKVATTGIGFDFKTITVTVTTPEGCIETDQRTIIFDFAACTGINDPMTESGFRIYPNPGNGLIYIENNAGAGNYLLSITDIFGREIIKNLEITFSDTDRTFILDCGSFPTGLYLIKISENGKNIVSMKYVLKH